MTIPLDPTCPGCGSTSTLTADGRLDLYWNDGHPDPGGNFGITASFQVQMTAFAPGSHTDLTSWVVQFDLAPHDQFVTTAANQRTCTIFSIERTPTGGVQGSLECTGVDLNGEQFQLHGDFSAEP